MTKLTLPIQIGRKYVRRDGEVITARQHEHDSVLCLVTLDGRSGPACWIETGRIYGHGVAGHPCDLVADYVEREPINAEVSDYAEILRAIADSKDVQWLSASGVWADQFHGTTLIEIGFAKYPPDRYRVKPKTIRIGEFDVPEPLREAPSTGTMAYYPLIHPVSLRVGKVEWHGDGDDRAFLANGLLHLTRAAAELHARALLSFTKATP